MTSINFPTNPQVNDTYTFGTKSWKWNGTSWVSIDSTLVGTTVTVSDTPPAIAGTTGSIWYNPLSGSLAIAVDNYWVTTGKDGKDGATGPSGAAGSSGTSGTSGTSALVNNGGALYLYTYYNGF